MKILLDTHTLLWWLSDDDRLGPLARDLIANPANHILISSASLWEMAVKIRIGKLQADMEQILTQVNAEEFSVLDISPVHLLALIKLPLHHRDPFDHLLIAQAMAEDAIFMSADENTPKYPVLNMACA
jgi:PIN domain nuclease of toxin-antitoxin system